MEEEEERGVKSSFLPLQAASASPSSLPPLHATMHFYIQLWRTVSSAFSPVSSLREISWKAGTVECRVAFGCCALREFYRDPHKKWSTPFSHVLGDVFGGTGGTGWGGREGAGHFTALGKNSGEATIQGRAYSPNDDLSPEDACPPRRGKTLHPV